METIYRQIAFHRLADAQKQAKLVKDSEYEIAVRNLSATFYQKKRSVGVTPEEEESYKQASSKLWNDYKTWAIGEGLYEEVTPEQQLAEAEDGLNSLIEEVNTIRQELRQKPIEIVEKSIEAM